MNIKTNTIWISKQRQYEYQNKHNMNIKTKTLWILKQRQNEYQNKGKMGLEEEKNGLGETNKGG